MNENNKLRDMINEEIDKFLLLNPDYLPWSRVAIRALIKEQERNSLYEGLIKSEQRYLVLKKLKKFNFDINYVDNNRIHAILNKKNLTLFKDNIDEFYQLLNVVGWYIAEFISISKDEKNNNVEKSEKFTNKELILNSINNNPFEVEFLLEPKFDIVITGRIPKKLYHTSPTIFRDKIKKYGLIPRSGNKILYHPERIYFGLSLDATKWLIKQLYNKIPKENNKFNTNVTSFDIYEFDTTRNSQIHYYRDPNFNQGCFTFENINPSDLTIIETINVI